MCARVCGSWGGYKMLRKVGESEVLNDVVGEVVEAGRMSANVGERRRNDADVNGELICAAV